MEQYLFYLSITATVYALVVIALTILAVSQMSRLERKFTTVTLHREIMMLIASVTYIIVYLNN